MRYLLFSSFATLIIPLVLAGGNPKVTEKVIFDIEIDGEKAGKIEIGLFGKIVPKTVKNFVELCKRPYGEGYKGSRFHYADMFLIEAGYFANANGTKGSQSDDQSFDRENFELKHYGAGWVSMVNTKSRKNNSLFFITLRELDWCDNINVVFGKVIKGMRVVKMIPKQRRDFHGNIQAEVVIVDCTVEAVKKKFTVEKDDAVE